MADKQLKIPLYEQVVVVQKLPQPTSAWKEPKTRRKAPGEQQKLPWEQNK